MIEPTIASRLQPKTVLYQERRTIDPEDIGFQTNVYEIHLDEQPIFIVIGKIKYTYVEKNVVYFPIYLVMNDEVTDQIGVFEVSADRAIELEEEDGEINTQLLGEELLFSFAQQFPFLYLILKQR